MFFEEDRIAAFREMICSDTVEEREAALEKILPYQQNDFKQLYEALEGNPVTIRFLDPPLHEFVPTEEADIEKVMQKKYWYNRQEITFLKPYLLTNWCLTHIVPICYCIKPHKEKFE